MTHKPLKAGDIRQKGDEYCQTKMLLEKKYEEKTYRTGISNPVEDLPYRPVTSLFGHAILESDLILHSFRRPINE